MSFPPWGSRRSVLIAVAICAGVVALGLAFRDDVVDAVFGAHSSFARLPEFQAFLLVCLATAPWLVFLSHRLSTASGVEAGGKRRPWLSPLAAFIALSAGIVITAAVTYRFERASVTRVAVDRLEAVARLKVELIENWLDETVEDLRISTDSQEFAERLSAWHRSGWRDARAAERVRGYLSRLSKTSHFVSVRLRRPDDGVAMVAIGADSENEDVRRQAMAVARSGKSALEDFHVEPDHDVRHHVGFFVPVMDPERTQTIGVIHIAVDPARVLLPLIERWPGSVTSGEVVLARIDGDHLTIMNDLRDRPDSTSLQEVPLDLPGFFAAPFVRGRWGVMTGNDDRKVPVLAYGLPVPRTSWFLAAKVDQAEAYAELNTLAFMSATVLGILMLFVAWWWVENHRNVAARMHHHFEQRMLSRRIEFLAKFANDCIVQSAPDGSITDVNDRCLSNYGYSVQDMLAMNVADLRAPQLRASMAATFQELRERGSLIFQTEHRRKDGSVFPVEISARAIDVDGAQCVQAIIRDISDRKDAEARILGLARLYATISAVNQAIVRARDIDQVFRLVCRACVEHGRFRMAWVGLVDEGGALIRPREAYGEGTAYLDEAPILIGAHGAGEPTAVAFDAQRAYTRSDFSDCGERGAWCETAVRHGLRAAIALPLRGAGSTIGALTVYSASMDFLDAETVELVTEMAENLSFAIDHFSNEELRRAAESASRQSEARLQQAQAIAQIGDWEFDYRTRRLTISLEAARLLGQPAEGATSLRAALRNYVPSSRRLIRDALHRAMHSGGRVAVELQYARPTEALTDHALADHALVMIPQLDANLRVVRVYGTVQDITARKTLEAERAEHVQRLAELSRRVVSVQEQERRHLSAELHDRTGANLAAINLNLIALARTLRRMPVHDAPRPTADEDDLIQETRDLLTDTIVSIREFCSELRPAMLDYAGLLPALENWAQQFGRRTGIRVRIAHDGFDGRCGPDAESTLYRITQEALTNCAKHASATSIQLGLESVGENIVLTIRDDGVGFDPATLGAPGREVGQGLLNMRERAEFAGGRFRVSSRPGAGTEIQVDIPARAGAAQADQPTDLGKNGSSFR